MEIVLKVFNETFSFVVAAMNMNMNIPFEIEISFVVCFSFDLSVCCVFLFGAYIISSYLETCWYIRG